jgi:23S rRNA G2445 N2-methylase RlmL
MGPQHIPVLVEEVMMFLRCEPGHTYVDATLGGGGHAREILRRTAPDGVVIGVEWDEDAISEARKTLDFKIIATDIRTTAVEAARKNAATAGVEHLIEFGVCDFSETAIPGGDGIVILNPEYGERMGKITELESLYNRIGDFFKQKCMGYTGYIFTGNPGLAKKVGLRAKRKIQFFNSAIECRLLEYVLYEGSRKSKYTDIQGS